MSRYSEEHDELRSVVRRLLEDKSPETRVRALLESDEGYDEALWEQMAGQLGLQGLLVPKEFGGSGSTLLESCVVLEELGRSLVGTPFLASAVLSATLLAELGVDDVTASLLTGIADGSIISTIAAAETVRYWGHDERNLPGTTATRRKAEWFLDGEKLYVLDGGVADTILVSARTDAGCSVFVVAAESAGLDISAMRTTDRTRRLSRVVFNDTPARLIGTDGAAGRPLSHVLDVCSIALCADAAGGTLKLIELSAHYAGIRTQFGRVIGRNQAVKQKLAEMVSSVELARAVALRVSLADRSELPLEASMAKAFCSEVYVQAAYDAIQVHGGIGFTWEHPTHLYFRRAVSDSALFGTPDQHRELAARRLGL